MGRRQWLLALLLSAIPVALSFWAKEAGMQFTQVCLLLLGAAALYRVTCRYADSANPTPATPWPPAVPASKCVPSSLNEYRHPGE